ncbi:ADP-ribosylglycohydrolase family protein [Planotetraspora kaengkrachanensis]|uniref:VOC domain-containing protein n=1 Tax=Planotetraspora kaengkrachanensis TaxID=575193 RepID=A0A8J3PSX2_9ACTN|nr:ADP-ribosylglycohydrolase family protein [Planotetraspora kaengkrachanensis]GIG79954.1 hypothetical protein Pka01_30810 [Planotetraspora kaengkrachanensis]
MTPSDTVSADRALGIIVGAAVGDALGWPQELRSSIVGGQRARNVPPAPQFRQWERNSGTQFARYQETVAAGEYSDDTQLLLAVARSCLRRSEWLTYLTQVELPTWLLYQRGAGRAVLAAARAWANGHAPWIEGDGSRTHRAKDPVGTYFNAGANGAAMRIAPHVIVTVSDVSTAELLHRVLLDGIATHGHPRALVGAVIHALSIRHALLQQGTLEYGGLIDSLLSDQSWQNSDLLHDALPSDWLQAFEQAHRQSPKAAWAVAAHETLELLQIAHHSLERAALANDEHTLSLLGAFDKTRNGAGTITAVAAAYIATRAAARPITGLLRSAFLASADTDTLASMTASVLGAIHGTAWLGPLARDVQDAQCLRDITARLAAVVNERTATHQQAPLFHAANIRTSVGTKEIEHFRSAAFGGQSDALRCLPDGREITSYEQDRRQANKSGLIVTRVRLTTSDRQTLILHKTYKTGSVEEGRSFPQVATTEKPGGERYPDYTTQASVLEIKLRVSDLEKAVHFYRDILNLRVERFAENAARLDNGLTLMQLPRQEQHKRTFWQTGDLLITIAVHDFGEVVRRATNSDLSEILSLENTAQQRQMRLRDPDGHNLMIIGR